MSTETKQKPQRLNLSELVQSAKASHADAFGKTNDKRSLAITQAVLTELGQQIAAAEEGAISVIGFGKFIVRQKTVQKDGQEIVQRSIRFNAGKKKAS